jgi:hypothetical protein
MTKLKTVALLTAIVVFASSDLSLAKPSPDRPTDRLSLTDAQQARAYDDLYMSPFAQTPPPGFKAVVGAVVPYSIATGRMTSKAASDVPALGPYKFAMIKNKLLIVNPLDNKIAEVVSS